MERLVLAGLLLASLIVQTTRNDARPAAADQGPPAWAAPMAPMAPMPPPPPPPPMPPPSWLGVMHGPGFDFDVDVDLDHLSLGRVISRELAAGEQETCPGGTVCSFACKGGGCKVDCDGGSVCAVSCAGGRCHNACGEGAVCSLACDGGDCSSTCGEGAICHVADEHGADHVQRHRHHHGHRS